MKNTYIYIIIDKTSPGEWLYKDIKLNFQPIYVGMGSGDRYKRHITTKLHKCENNYTKFNKKQDEN